MSLPPELVAIAEALDEAVQRDAPIRIGIDHVRTLHAFLLDRLPAPAHEHTWQPLGYDRASADTPARVVSACACGAAQEVTP